MFAWATLSRRDAESRGAGGTSEQDEACFSTVPEDISPGWGWSRDHSPWIHLPTALYTDPLSSTIVLMTAFDEYCCRKQLRSIAVSLVPCSDSSENWSIVSTCLSYSQICKATTCTVDWNWSFQFFSKFSNQCQPVGELARWSKWSICRNFLC